MKKVANSHVGLEKLAIEIYEERGKDLCKVKLEWHQTLLE